MPLRLGVLLILAFWLAVAGTVLYRDVWPRYSHDSPAVLIELSDEATRSVPGRWGVFRDDTRLGTLTTRLEPIDADGTYAFVSSYQHLSLTTAGVTVTAKTLDLTTRLHGDGRLAGQGMQATLSLSFHGVRLDGKANVQGKVINGVLEGRCTVKSSLLDLDEPLLPMPVPPGPVLHPMQPMNRLKNVQPGQQWVIREINPLADAVSVLVAKVIKQHGGLTLPVGHGERPKMIAEVKSEPVLLARRGGEVSCWLIEYRGNDATAKTWVAIADGKVMRQEAQSLGETLRLERED